MDASMDKFHGTNMKYIIVVRAMKVILSII